MTEADEATESPELVPPVPAPTVPGAIPDVPLNADGRERPRFLLDFPNDPELQRLVRAFEAGNYAVVREDAPKLAERTDDLIVRAAARELRRRIDPDPLMKYMLWVALGLFVFVVWYTYQGQQ
ncbi:MAG: hypothetical protein ABIQ16_09585 [Polyangiaceae bacterium]